MKTMLTAIFLLLGFLFLQASDGPTWLRYPSISPDGQWVVFTYRGDLYSVPVTGGQARQLTQHEAHDFMPVWSHDGKQIAFASDRYGNFDIYVMPSTGGNPRRLTYHSAAEYPYDFSRDDKQVIFGAARLDLASNRQYPTGYLPELYQVSATGGNITQVLGTPAEYVRVLEDGRYLYQDKKGQEDEWRKHHTSSVARDCWIYDPATGKHRKLTSNTGEDRNPVPVSGSSTFYYLSEAGGSFNVYSNTLNKDQPTALTRFTRHPVRFLSRSNNGTLCFGYNGDLYTMKDNTEPVKLAILIDGDMKKNQEQLITVSSGAREMAVSPNGKEIAFIFRGEVFVSSVEGGITKRITNTPGQERSVSFSPDGKTLLYASERGDRWKIYQTKVRRTEEPYFYASTVLDESALLNNEQDNYQPRYSPDGKCIAYIEDRVNLKVFTPATGQSRSLLSSAQLASMSDNDQYFDWSPDSRWLLFDYSIPGSAYGEVGIVSADGKVIRNLTQSGFSDANARWIMGGKAITWFSNRDGLSSKANSGTSQSDVYAAFLDQEAWDHFRLNKEDASLLKDLEEKLKADSTKKPVVKKDSLLRPDFDAFPYRKSRLTIHSSTLADALVSKDGENLYYLARFEKGYNLWNTNLRTRETKILSSMNSNGRGSMAWDKEQKNIFLNADGKISKINPVSGLSESIGINGEMSIDIDQERRCMFEHVWRRTKATFYTASMHGVKWDSYRPDYERYLPHIGTNYEFAEMLCELLGELNVSHSGADYYPPQTNADATASVGIFTDYSYKGNGLKIMEVLKDGPLDKADINVRTGDILLAIDGDTLFSHLDPAQFLNRKAGKFTLLTILEGGNTKYFRVKPITQQEQNSLFYRRWIQRNEAEVKKLSNGQLGYVHIPGMNDASYRNIYEEIMGKHFNRKGIVVDTRNNGGGDLVADLAMFLSGKQFMDYTTDTRSSGYEPSFRWTKPSISLANESNYSDGHCYAYAYQHLQLGKLVGQPVPGTCTFAAWEALQDNTLTWGVPPLGVKTMEGKYLENSQTNPDINVWNDLDQVIKGRDQQLEIAVKTLLEDIKK